MSSDNRHFRGPFSAVVAAHARSLGRSIDDPKDKEPRISRAQIKSDALNELRAGQLFPERASRNATRSLYRHDRQTDTEPDRAVDIAEMRSSSNNDDAGILALRATPRERECETNNWMLSAFQRAAEESERRRTLSEYGTCARTSVYSDATDCGSGLISNQCMQKDIFSASCVAAPKRILHDCPRADDPRYTTACSLAASNNIASIYARQAK